MELGQFKDLAAGIQSILVAIAVLVGGAWALFRFFSLKEVKKATAELQKIRQELQSRGHLQITIDAKDLHSKEPKSSYINLTLTITNVGNHAEVIRWSESRIVAAPVSQGSEGETQLGERIEAPMHMDFQLSIVNRDTTESYAFLIPVKSEGVYFLEASLAGSPTEMSAALDKAASVGMDQPSEACWGARMYFRSSRNSEEQITASDQ